MSKQIYYNVDPIDKLGATINILYGERSNGKSYQLKHKKGIYPYLRGVKSYRRDYTDKDTIIEENIKAGTRFILLRRQKEEISSEKVLEYLKDIDIMELTDDKYKIDTTLRETTGKAWKTMSDEEKDGLFEYTDDAYGQINRLLGGRALTTYDDPEQARDQIESITSALNKSTIPVDMWVRRGLSERQVTKLFGGYTRDDILEAINNGAIGSMDNFASCGATPRTGLYGDLELKIFVPKGTKGMYLEPISANGQGAGLGWDGEAGQSSLGGELEILLQRGTKIKPIAYNPKAGMGGTDQIVVIITGQETGEIPEPIFNLW